MKKDSASHLSASQIEQIKVKVLIKKEKALSLIEENRSNGNGTDDTARTFEPLEEGFKTQMKEENVRIIESQNAVIRECDKVLTLMAKGEYDGICKITGQPIPFERLLAQPFATKTVECKNGMAVPQNGNGKHLLPNLSAHKIPNRIKTS